MADNTKAIGSKITWKTWEYTLGPTVDATWVNIKTIRNTDTVFTNGLMEDFTSAIGCAENNTDSEFTRQPKLISNMVFGKKEKESNGLMINKLRKSRIPTKTLGFISKSQRMFTHRYMDHLINRSISTISYKKYKTDSVSSLITSLIEGITVNKPILNQELT